MYILAFWSCVLLPFLTATSPPPLHTPRCTGTVGDASLNGSSVDSSTEGPAATTKGSTSTSTTTEEPEKPTTPGGMYCVVSESRCCGAAQHLNTTYCQPQTTQGACEAAHEDCVWTAPPTGSGTDDLEELSGDKGATWEPVAVADTFYVKLFDGECKEGSDTLKYSGCYYAIHNKSVNHDDNPGTTPEENIAECALACRQDASGYKGFEVIPSTGRCWCSNADGLTCTAISSRRHDGTCTTKDNGAGYERFDFGDGGKPSSGSSGETCVSAPDYRHPDGENCAEMASYCSGYGNDRGTQEDGRSANQACCECGGSSDFSGSGFSGSGETCVSAPDYRHPDGENCAEMA